MTTKTIENIQADLKGAFRLKLDKSGCLVSKSAIDDKVTERLESKGWSRVSYDVAYGGFSSTATLRKDGQVIDVMTGASAGGAPARGCRIRVVRGL